MNLTIYGGIIAALPLVSLLSIICLYIQGEQTAMLTKFALGELWRFPATTVMLVLAYSGLQKSFHLFIAIGLGIKDLLIFLFVQSQILKYIRTLL